jgi:hypothetical protein
MLEPPDMIACPDKFTRSAGRIAGPGLVPWLLALLLLSAAAGCRMGPRGADTTGPATHTATTGAAASQLRDPVDLQQNLLRFADEFSAGLNIGVDQLRTGMADLAPAEKLRWKIALTSKSIAIASGPNALANLIDMTVFVTAMRMMVEDHWQPKVYGASAQALLDNCRVAETNIWRLTGKWLNPEQQAELRNTIEQWRRQDPLPESVLVSQGIDFTAQVAGVGKAERAAPGSVFDLLRLDPLSGLDPATREIAEARLFAERALYVTQKFPTLLRWQSELLSVHATELPAVQQLVTNTTRFTAAVDRVSRVAEQLPAQLSAERAAILADLRSQEKELAPLVAGVGETFRAGTQLSAALNTTVVSFDGLMKRFGVGEPKPAGPTGAASAPFRIQDYTETAAQFEATARQLNELLRGLDQTLASPNLARLSAQVGPVVEQAQAGGKEVVDYAFRQGVLLVGIALAAALVYRFLAARLTPADRSRSRQP